MQEIELIQTPNQEFLTVLDEQNCTIRIRQLGDNLFFTLYVDQDLIVENSIIAINQKIIQSATKAFKGNFVMYAPSYGDTSIKPSYDNLNTIFKLYFVKESEIVS